MTAHLTSRDELSSVIGVHIRCGDVEVLDERFTSTANAIAAISEHGDPEATDLSIRLAIDPSPVDDLVAVLRAVADLLERRDTAASRRAPRGLRQPQALQGLRLRLEPGVQPSKPLGTRLQSMQRELSHPGD